ncbi:MAG TPA: tellurite resistance TerB C-terminal domain-containing protein, partial [Thermoanaerobaculia bacterium]|nr:tellurite resistance TerB C-terminal domain-containing protein [Thermoanaerobaculia bacterium]
SAADDTVSQAERDLLERHIDERLQLTAGERQRLAAHLAWLLEADLGLSGLKRKLEALPQEARRAVGRLLVDVAGSDGQVDAREMKMLEKLYDLLDLPSADLYRDVHAVQAQDDEPVVVAQPAADAKGFAIPPKPAPATTPAGIDMERVRLKIAETRQVSTLLSSIFVEEEAPVAVAPAIAQAGVIGTLDAAHSELLRRLAQRESWPRDEVERLAAGLALLPDGALETINDYAYTAANEPLWEDDDPVSINSKVAMELIA